MLECVRAARFKLEYSTTEVVKQPSSPSAPTLAGIQQVGGDATSGTAGRQIMTGGDAAGQHDLAALHALHFGRLQGSYERALARQMTGADKIWGIKNWVVMVLLVVFAGALVYVSLRKHVYYYKSMTTKVHGRSD